MRARSYFYLSALFATSCISIIRVPNRGQTDGSESFTTVSPSESGPLTIKVATSATIDSLSHKPGKTWLVVWAPWCAVCVGNLEKYQQLASSNDYQLVLLSTSYKADYVRKYLSQNNYQGVTYLVSAQDYSSNEAHKTTLLRQQLAPLSPEVETAIPQNYFFNNGRLIGHQVGSVSQLPKVSDSKE